MRYCFAIKLDGQRQQNESVSYAGALAAAERGAESQSRARMCIGTDPRISIGTERHHYLPDSLVRNKFTEGDEKDIKPWKFDYHFKVSPEVFKKYLDKFSH
jgi:hypothetical protein